MEHRDDHDEGFAADALDGLAASWEASFEIREFFRNKTSLLSWPKAVGVPSMIPVCKWVLLRLSGDRTYTSGIIFEHFPISSIAMFKKYPNHLQVDSGAAGNDLFLLFDFESSEFTIPHVTLCTNMFNINSSKDQGNVPTCFSMLFSTHIGKGKFSMICLTF